MRRITLLLLFLLSGCDLDNLQTASTIRAGHVFWDGPDVPRLVTALQTCTTATADLKSLCDERRTEAMVLLSAIRSCSGVALPTCIEIIGWAKKGDGRDWRNLLPFLGMTTKDLINQPRENLNTPLPGNRFIWAIWGWSDVQEITYRWIQRHQIHLFLMIGLLVAIPTGQGIWGIRMRRVEQAQRAAQDRQYREASEARRIQMQKQEAEARIRQEQWQAQLYRENQALQARLEEEEVARKSAAEAEEARAKAILAEAFKPQQTNPQHKRQRNKWKGHKPKTTPQIP